MPSCTAADLDGLMRCTLERTAHAEEVFFAHHGRHRTATCEDLEVAVPRGVLCMVTPKANGFTATASHASVGVCLWDSTPPAGQDPLRCS